MKTNSDYTTTFRHYGNVTVPKGTRLTHETAMGIDEKYHFVDDFSWVNKSYPDYSVGLVMDLQNYGLDVPKEYVDGEYNYYKEQLSKVKPSKQEAMKVRLNSREGFTNWLRLNDESAKELIIWLQNNFPNCMDKEG